MLSPCQCRMARAALGLSGPRSAERARISVPTLAGFGLGKRTPYERTPRDVQMTFERPGVKFPDGNEDGEGACIRHG